MKLSPRLALVPIVISLVSASCGKSTQSSTKTEISSKSNNLPSQGLGEGFNSENQSFVSQCLTGKTSYIGDANSQVENAYEMSYEDVVDTLSGGVNLGAKFSIFNIEGAADYASREASDDFSYTTSIKSTVELPKVAFEPTGLSAVGRSLVNGSGDISDDVKKVCGDEYISHITYGASLFVNMKFRFQSSQDKEEFKGKASVSLAAIGELGGNLAKLSDRIKKNTSVTISAYQVGGNVQNLSMILDEKIFKCSMEDFEASCMPMLNNLVNYAKNEFPKSLSNPVDPNLSLEQNVEKIKNSGWSQLRFTTKKYSEKAVKIDGIERAITLVAGNPKSLITREIKLARDEVYEAYEKELSAYQRSTDMIKEGGLNNVQRDNIKAVQKATSDNKRTLANVGETCTRNPENCIADFEDYKKNAKAWDERALSLKTCLVAEDVADSVWEFSRTNNTPIGVIRLARGGKIELAASGADVTWKVEGCLLRFYNENGAHTSTFDDIQSWDLMTGIYYFDGSFRHILKRLDPESDQVKNAIKNWKAPESKGTDASSANQSMVNAMKQAMKVQQNAIQAEIARKNSGK